jgi:hypothetical protein
VERAAVDAKDPDMAEIWGKGSLGGKMGDGLEYENRDATVMMSRKFVI